jgi:hypothetical protein
MMSTFGFDAAAPLSLNPEEATAAPVDAINFNMSRRLQAGMISPF